MRVGDLREVVRGLYAQASGAVVGVFDTRKLTEMETAMVQGAVSHCTFNWSRLAAKMPAPAQLSVATLPKGTWATTAYTPGKGPAKITLDTRLQGRGQHFQETTILGETAHLLDYFLLTDQQRRDIIVLFDSTPDANDKWGTGPYWQEVGESFMALFIYAYSDLEPEADLLRFTHKPTRAIAKKARAIIES